jgi:ATP-dependent DNA helicase RecG
MIQALRRAGLTAPRFDSSLTRFRLTIPKHALLDSEALIWLAALGQGGLTDTQCMALALMREGMTVTNATLRQLGLGRLEATGALTDLVARGLAVSFDGRRYAKYVLAVDPGGAAQLALPLPAVGGADRQAVPTLEPGRSLKPRDRLEDVDRLFDSGETLGIGEVVVATGLKRAMAARYLNRLVSAGRIAPTAPPTSRWRAYHRVLRPKTQ